MNTRGTKHGIVSGNLHGFVADGSGNSAPDLDTLVTKAIGTNPESKKKLEKKPAQGGEELQERIESLN